VASLQNQAKLVSVQKQALVSRSGNCSRLDPICSLPCSQKPAGGNSFRLFKNRFNSIDLLAGLPGDIFD
jgi:hypothetical protein